MTVTVGGELEVSGRLENGWSPPIRLCRDGRDTPCFLHLNYLIFVLV
jgi:hypothetical protein